MTTGNGVDGASDASDAPKVETPTDSSMVDGRALSEGVGGTASVTRGFSLSGLAVSPSPPPLTLTPLLTTGVGLC